MAQVELTRRDDWMPRLAAVANSRRHMAYAYGVNDCWCFARAAVEAMTDELLLPDVEPPKSRLAAAKVMVCRGWADIEDMMAEILPAAGTVRAGDIVSYEMGDEYHLAVALGGEAIAPCPDGLRVVPRRLWRRAWRVG